MEIYDIVMLVVLLAATLFGAFKGFAWQLASIASIVVSYIVAHKYLAITPLATKPALPTDRTADAVTPTEPPTMQANIGRTAMK